MTEGQDKQEPKTFTDEIANELDQLFSKGADPKDGHRNLKDWNRNDKQHRGPYLGSVEEQQDESSRQDQERQKFDDHNKAKNRSESLLDQHQRINHKDGGNAKERKEFDRKKDLRAINHRPEMMSRLSDKSHMDSRFGSKGKFL
jgi:hypothetical protein